MTILSKAFWDYALERAVKTFAQTALAALGGGSVGLIDIDWVGVGSLSGGAALLSVLTSVVSKSRSE